MALRIALLTYATKPRGSVIHTLELAEALAKLGHQPHVFALDKDGRGFHRSVNCFATPVPAQPCTGGTDQLVQQRIDEFVQFFRQRYFQTPSDQTASPDPAPFDIYHAQDCLSANALAQLKAEGYIPHFVRTVHHIEDFQSPYLRDCQEKSIFCPDRCLCVSELWQQVLRRDYDIDAHRVVNGVSARFSAQLSGQESSLAQRYGLSGNPIFLTVGGIEPRKNSLQILRAFQQVRQHHPQAQLMIAGGATLFDYQSYRDAFMVEAQSLPPNALVLPGVVPDEDLPVLYRLADAFVFPSLQEGWGLVILEAIASGLPVIASNRQPFTEFLSKETALLVEPEVDAMAKPVHRTIALAMVQVLQPETAQPLIHNSQPLIDRYTWHTSAQQHLALYHQLSSPK
ncbi:MAG: MSMEG_0565 family glycosyltransferase [Cyanobacteria bacterium P01_A01_bin.105]